MIATLAPLKMKVLVNNEGQTEGTLLELLQRCCSSFGEA